MKKKFPSSIDYMGAFDNFAKCVLDTDLKAGVPRRGKFVGGSDLYRFSGNWALVFVVDVGTNPYVVRCWTEDIGDAEQHYVAIDLHLKQHALPYFAQCEFVRDGIRCKGATFPILKMDWVEGPSLHAFIKNNLSNPDALDAAAHEFLKMTKTLRQSQIAHGDLQSDNIKVLSDGGAPSFKLIDYDTLVVPGREGTPISSPGIPGYQHPARQNSKTASLQDDHFGEMVIYLTLRALSVAPELWDEFGMNAREKELLFTGDDFKNRQPSAVFRRLRSLSPNVGSLALMLWNYTRHAAFNDLPALADAVQISEKRKSTFVELLEQKKARSGQAQTRPAVARLEWLREWEAETTVAQRPAPPIPLVSGFDDALTLMPVRAQSAEASASKPASDPNNRFGALMAKRAAKTASPGPQYAPIRTPAGVPSLRKPFTIAMNRPPAPVQTAPPPTPLVPVQNATPGFVRIPPAYTLAQPTPVKVPVVKEKPPPDVLHWQTAGMVLLFLATLVFLAIIFYFCVTSVIHPVLDARTYALNFAMQCRAHSVVIPMEYGADILFFVPSRPCV